MDILYRDSEVVVIGKEVGATTEATLESAGEILGSFVRPIHRLDQPVSGAVTGAFTRRSASALSTQISDNTFERSYIAVCERGEPVDAGTWEDLVTFDRGTNRSRAGEPPRGKPARLASRKIGETDRYGVWNFSLETGRRHQIRIQCALRGIPIVGDLKYGARRSRKGGGIYLHGWCVAFSHPSHGRRIVVRSYPVLDPLWAAAMDLALRNGGATGLRGSA